MPIKQSLHSRIIISYAVFGVTMGVILFLFLYISYDLIEEKLLASQLENELEYFLEISKNTQIDSLRTRLLDIQKIDINSDAVPNYVRPLPPGFHEIHLEKKDLVVNIVESPPYKYILQYDITEWEKFEHGINTVFSILIVVLSSCAVWYGYYLGRRVISPVKRLASIIESIPAHEFDIDIEKNFAKDEVGSLARSFELYLRRIKSFLKREQNFVTDASHELRTPLAVIQGSTEMLLSTGNVAKNDRNKLSRILRSVKNMTRSIDALLILAREPKKEPANQSGVSVADIVSDTIDTHHEQIAELKIDVQVQYEYEPEIYAPDAIVLLLVNNLIQNAIRYTPGGSISIHLCKNRLIVADTGIGIPESDLDKIFERGYRATNASDQGSGLGLSLVKHICNHFDWEIEVSSVSKRGTKVVWKFAD